VPFEDYLDLADTPEEAQRRFDLAKRNDPFPIVTPSLLNSADVDDYVRATGMLYPFHRSDLKSASYEAAIFGRCIHWNAAGEYQEVQLRDERDEFILRANSIAFVQIEPFLRIPDYIALRFNLKITHVHRGILLGTGPLVDPGFVGELLIPLHNLTTNDYRFKCREGLIWIEFTKTSTLPRGDTQSPGGMISRRARYKGFDPTKTNVRPEEYLRKSSPHRPIRSSIPDAVRDSQKAAEKAARLVQIITAAGVIGLIVTILGVLVPTWGLIQDATRSIQTVEQQLRETQARNLEVIRKVEEQMQSLRMSIVELERRIGVRQGSTQKQDGAEDGGARRR
jgi:deoxycytidine triphosphate deaminase